MARRDRRADRAGLRVLGDACGDDPCVAGDLFVVRDPEGRYAGIHVNEEHAHGHDHEH